MWSDQPDVSQERLSDVDRALVHALRTDPRAPWARIAQVLGVDAATVARRWSALTDARGAWFTVTCAPPAETRAVAMVLVPGPADDVELETWASAPETVAVDRTSAGTLLLLTDTTPHALTVSAAALVPRRHVVEHVLDAHLEDRRHLGALTPDQVAALTPEAGEPGDRSSRAPRPETVREIAALLREDARMSLGAIAARLDVSDATARRLVERVLGLGLVQLGCDVAADALGLHREVVLRLATLDPPLAHTVSNHPAVWRVVRSVGPAAATVHVRLGTLADLPEVEARWAGAHVLDRWSVVAPVLRHGRRLAPDGRPLG